MVISGMRFLMLREALLNLSINVHKGSPFSCLMLRRVMKDIWCGRLVVYWVLNFADKVLKLPIEFDGSWVNQLSAPPHHLIVM